MPARSEKHADVAAMLFELSDILWRMEDLPAARKACERAVRIDTDIYGAGHEEVISDKIKLAAILRDAEELEEARALNEEAVRGMEAYYNAKHPDVARAVSQLAGTLDAIGKLEEDVAKARAGKVAYSIDSCIP